MPCGTSNRILSCHNCQMVQTPGAITADESWQNPYINPKVLPPIRRPIQQQTRLGWDQLYHDHVAMGLAQAIDAIHPKIQLTGEQVMTQLSKIIWTFFLETWTTRNNHLHQNAGQLNLPNYCQVAINLYEQRHLPPEAQDTLYQQPLKALLKQPAPRLQMWTKHGLSYFTQQLRAAKTQAKLHTLDIRIFLAPKLSPPHDHQPP